MLYSLTYCYNTKSRMNKSLGIPALRELIYSEFTVRQVYQ